MVALAGALGSAAACSADDNAASRGPGNGTTSGVGGGGGGTTAGACFEGLTEECHITVDANNGIATCMDGVRTCHDGKWGSCTGSITKKPYAQPSGSGAGASSARPGERIAQRVSATSVGRDGSLGPGSTGGQPQKPLSLSPNANCVNNPCDPTCQIFDEIPMAPITIPGAPPPGGIYEAGSITDLTGNQQQSGLKNPCADNGDCLYDHYCDPGTNTCQPWLPGQFAACGGPDLTAGIACMNAGGVNSVALCNRGDAVATGPIEIDVFNGGSTNDYFSCTGAGISSVFTGSCSFAGNLVPGECTNVLGCDAFFGGTDTFVVNGPQPPATQAPIAECECKNNWSGYHNGNACSPPACSAIHVTGSVQGVNMHFVLDNSTSMNNNGKFTAGKAALTGFFQDPASAGLNVSLRLFGDNPVAGCNNVACNAAACSTPLVPFGMLTAAAAPADVQEDALVTALAPYVAGGGTPMSALVDGTMTYLMNYSIANPGGLEVFVFITDGDNLQCDTNFANIAAFAAAGLAAEGIKTYVIALPNAILAGCDQIAAAGGTGSAFFINSNVAAVVQAAMTAQLLAIKNANISCNIALPNAGNFDPNTSTATWLPSLGGTVPLVRVNDAGACSGANNEYYYDNNANPTAMILCVNTCSMATADPTGTIDFAAACPVSYPNPFVYKEVYQGVCPAGKGVQWGFMAYNSITPLDSNIVFEGHTSATNGPFTDPLKPLATAQAAPDTQVCPMAGPPPCPVNLFQQLGGIPEATTEYLEVVATFNPSSNQAASPQLNNWQITYSCIDTE